MNRRAVFLFGACCWTLLSLPTRAQALTNTSSTAETLAEKEAIIQQIERITPLFDEALKQQNWIRANDFIQEIVAIAPTNPRINKMQTSLQEAMKQWIESRTNDALFEKLKNKALHEEALQNWKAAQVTWEQLLDKLNAFKITDARLREAENGYWRARGPELKKKVHIFIITFSTLIILGIILGFLARKRN
jgi:flagellar biosynthesis chaperone FliJ